MKNRSSFALAWLFAATLLTSCGGGGSDSPSPPPAPPSGPGPAQITVSGTAEYESVPASNGGSLNYSARSMKKIRGATVQLLNGSTGAVLATTTLNASGAYSFPAVANPSTPVVVRVRAELKDTNTDITVKNNIVSGTEEPALYVLDSSPVTPTTAATSINVSANSGWGGSGYTAPRSAAPFAVLDVVYDGVQKVRSVGQGLLPPLQIFWSPANKASKGTVATGQIGTSSFSTGHPDTGVPGLRIYLLGDAATDTDEYDSAVVAHEWGHYLQTAVSRDDSVGGPHSANDKLDMRVAFSEGFGNAFAGMVRNDPRYTDSSTTASGQLDGFVIDVSQPPASGNMGWYSESSVQYLLWTWSQNASIGFRGIYNTLIGPMRTSAALVGIHHFAQRLKDGVTAAASLVATGLQGQNITAQDVWGTGETNNGNAPGSLPLYSTITNNAARACVSDAVGGPNKVLNFVYFRFTTAASTTTITVLPEGTLTGTDPDFEVIDATGVTTTVNGEVADLETKAISLPAGEHTLVVEDYKLTADSALQNQRCFSVTIN